MAYTSKISAVLLFAVLLYPVAAAVFAFVLLLGVKAEFTTKRIVTDKNEPFDISITLKNRSIVIFPTARSDFSPIKECLRPSLR